MTIINLGTYPPKQCGIATFSQDLRNGLELCGQKVEVISISDSSIPYQYGSEVKFTIRQEEKSDYYHAAQYINKQSQANMVIIQHEYGIFGGPDGEYILGLAKKLNKPYIVITHTVLPSPKRHPQSILHRLCSNAAAVVCMTKRSARLLSDMYSIPSSLIHVISHGVPEFTRNEPAELKEKYGLQGKTIISTFGLLGPGKGLEMGIKALVPLVKTYPDILYLILGQTHPVLKAREGESYRQMLQNLVNELGLQSHVRFVNKFLDDDELNDYLNLTDIYLSPYPNRDQAVSGTLAFAAGAGKAIVSTAYAYALEILGNGRGLLALENNPEQIAKLLGKIIANPSLKKSLEENAYQLGRTWSWPNIGRQYCSLFSALEQAEQEESPLHYARL